MPKGKQDAGKMQNFFVSPRFPFFRNLKMNICFTFGIFLYYKIR